MLVAQCLVPDINVGELNTTARMLNDNVASQLELERPFEDDVFNCDPDFRHGRCTAQLKQWPVPVIGQTASACTPSTLLRCSPLPLLFRQPSPAIMSSTANRKLGRLHCFRTTPLPGSALWRSAALPGHDHPCRTLATGRGFADPTSAGSHCHEAGGMTSISSSVGWPRDRPSVTRPPSERLDQAAPTFPAQAKAGIALRIVPGNRIHRFLRHCCFLHA